MCTSCIVVSYTRHILALLSSRSSSENIGCKNGFPYREKFYGSGGIRTHASEETGALNQRLRPLGHATLLKEYSQIELTVDRVDG